MTASSPASLTIGRLARAAGVGVETIRYYQQRGLLPVPTSEGSFRQYPVALTARIHFITGNPVIDSTCSGTAPCSTANSASLPGVGRVSLQSDGL